MLNVRIFECNDDALPGTSERPLCDGDQTYDDCLEFFMDRAREFWQEHDARFEVIRSTTEEVVIRTNQNMDIALGFPPLPPNHGNRYRYAEDRTFVYIFSNADGLDPLLVRLCESVFDTALERYGQGVFETLCRRGLRVPAAN